MKHEISKAKPTLLSPALERRLGELDAIERELQDLVSGLSPQQLCWRASAGSWSVLQCLAHLNRTVQEYLPMIDAGIARGREHGIAGSGESRGTRMGAWLIRAIEPPPKRRFRAPKRFQPAAGLEPAAVLADFTKLRNDLRQRIRACNGLDLGRIRISSPALKILRVSLGQAFEVLTAHDRRHLWQARNVRRDKEFPSDQPTS